jgi:hypothetical protein
MSLKIKFGSRNLVYNNILLHLMFKNYAFTSPIFIVSLYVYRIMLNCCLFGRFV